MGGTMINCPECGQELPDGTRFCTACGQACNRTARRVQQRAQMDVAETMPASTWDSQAQTSRMNNQQQPVQPYIQQPTMQMPSQQVAHNVGSTPGYSQDPYVSAPHSGRTAEAFVPAYAPQAAQQASAAAAAAGGTGRQKQGRRTAIIAAAVAVVLIVVVVAAAAWTSRANREASDAAQHADRHVTFALDAPDYDEAKDSPIPVRVSGTDLDGAQVDRVYYITPKNATIGLQQGSYTASVVASPLLSEGTLYKVPEELIDVQIRDKDLSGGDLNWTFEKMEPLDITDEQLDSSYEYALDSGMQKDRADALYDAVSSARQSALDEQAADQQAAADSAAAQADALAEEEARANARNFDDGYVALNVPDFWQGNFTSTTYDHTSGVFHTDFYVSGGSFVLLRIDGMAGDLSTYGATYTNAATEIWNSRHGGSIYSDWELDQALYLQTGGAITRDDVLACYDGYEAEALGEDYIGYFMDNNISPTVTTSRY